MRKRRQPDPEIVSSAPDPRPNKSIFTTDRKGTKTNKKPKVTPAYLSRPGLRPKQKEQGQEPPQKRSRRVAKSELVRVGRLVGSGPPTRPSHPSRRRDARDIWSDEGEGNIVQGKRKKRVPAPPVASQSVPPVAIPHPGSSINPLASDHIHQLKGIAEEAILVDSKKAAISAPALIRGGRAGNDESENEEDNEDVKLMVAQNVGRRVKHDDLPDDVFDDASDASDDAVAAPKASDRVTRAKRAKKTKNDERQRAALERRERNRREHDLLHVKSTVRSLKHAEAEKAVELEKRKDAKEKQLELKGAPRLGPLLQPHEEDAFLLPEDLPGSLRKLKPVGSLYRDRYLSLLKRGAAEPRKHVRQKRRYPLVTFERKRAITRLYEDQ